MAPRTCIQEISYQSKQDYKVWIRMDFLDVPRLSLWENAPSLLVLLVLQQQIFESSMIQPSIGKRQYVDSWYGLPNCNGKSKAITTFQIWFLLQDLIFRIFRNTCFSDPCRILSGPCSERLHFQPKLQKKLVIQPNRVSSHWYDDHQLSACRVPAHSLECNGFCPGQRWWVADVCRDQMLGALMKGKRVNIY